ncbi:MAG: hypothetical protein JNN13_04490 [Planctomycetes bacterium]|nr:hypothetical protein [Planctomycetota bacterium]
MRTSAQHIPPVVAASAPRRLLAVLMACALLLQSLWVPFHLAHEHHHAPGAAPALGAVAPEVGRVAELVAPRDATDDGRHHEPHSSLDHRIALKLKQRDDHPAGDLLFWPLLAPLRLPPAVAGAAAPRAPPGAAGADPGSAPPPSRAPPTGPFVRRC